MTEPRAWCIRLPWLKPPLNANDRLHHMARHRVTLVVRTSAANMLRGAGIPALTRCSLQLVYVPRDNRRRDTDNLVATLKVLADAAIDAGIVPDDTPQFMAKPEPIIRPAEPADPRLLLTVREVAADA